MLKLQDQRKLNAACWQCRLCCTCASVVHQCPCVAKLQTIEVQPASPEHRYPVLCQQLRQASAVMHGGFWPVLTHLGRTSRSPTWTAQGNKEALACRLPREGALLQSLLSENQRVAAECPSVCFPVAIVSKHAGPRVYYVPSKLAAHCSKEAACSAVGCMV